MTRHRILFVIMAFIAITTAIIVFKEPSPESKLDIVLRCDEGVSGTLSVISSIPDCDGGLRVEESFDVKAACEKGDLEYSHYRGWADVLFTLKRDNGEITRLNSEYAPDIQTDIHLGFVVMIRILNALPFLANDRI